MKYLLLSLLIWSGAAKAASPVLDYRFSVVDGGQEAILLAASTAVTFLNPNLPSCEVFAFRKKQMLKQAEEMDYLLERVNRRNGKWTKNDRAEFEQLRERQMRLERELKAPAVEASAVFEIPSDMTGFEWVGLKQYRLYIQTPTFRWSGFDASEPENVRVEPGVSGWTIRHRLFLTEYCENPLTIDVKLERK